MSSHLAMVRRALRLYRSATPEMHAAGVQWYAVAQDAARTIWPESPERAAGVIAALSPRLSWKTNVRYARAIVHTARTGQDCPTGLGLKRNTAIAWKIVTGAQSAEDALKGPKTSRFYRNIMGDMDCATIDVWMMRALLLPSEITYDKEGIPRAPKGRAYLRMESAVRRAAQIAGIPTAMMQAILWTLVRGSAA